MNKFVRACLEQARLAKSNHCSPNPAVGAILVGPSGQILGSGHTEKAGGRHAEIVALDNAKLNGHDVRGATLYVSLEPCSHRGRTGPCADALIAAGISKVVASVEDPNPMVCGNGFAKLREAKIEVEVGPGGAESQELNIGFFRRMNRQRPWVRTKIAASLDGFTALENGESQWITSEAARGDGHVWRARADCILTGIGTVIKDNPQLTVRPMPVHGQPTLAIIDSNLRTPPDAELFNAGRQVLIYTATEQTERQQALESAGATVIFMPRASANAGTMNVDLSRVVTDLAKREMNEVHVEAGQTLNGSLFEEGLVDELVLYLAPKLIGNGLNFAKLSALSHLADALTLNVTSVGMVATDVRIIARTLKEQSGAT